MFFRLFLLIFSLIFDPLKTLKNDYKWGYFISRFLRALPSKKIPPKIENTVQNWWCYKQKNNNCAIISSIFPFFLSCFSLEKYCDINLDAKISKFSLKKKLRNYSKQKNTRRFLRKKCTSKKMLCYCV